MIKINLAKPKVRIAVLRLTRREIVEVPTSKALHEFLVRIRLRYAGFDLNAPFHSRLDFDKYCQVFWQIKPH